MTLDERRALIAQDEVGADEKPRALDGLPARPLVARKPHDAAPIRRRREAVDA